MKLKHLFIPLTGLALISLASPRYAAAGWSAVAAGRRPHEPSRRSSMLNKGRILIVSLGLICASANAAADLCFDYDDGGGISAGDRFTLPLVNQCKPFNGFETAEPGGTAGTITGTGCTASNGGQFLLHYSFHNWFALGGNSYFESGTCRFPLQHGPVGASLPAPGLCRGTFVHGSNQGGFVQGARIFNCTRNVPASDGP